MSDYRATLNELPADWSVRRIDEIGSVISGGTPSRDVPAYWNGRVAWVTPGELTRLDSKHICATNECITEAGLANSGAALLPPGSLLVTTRATLGTAAVNETPIATNQGFKSVVFRNGHLSDYYYHWTRKLKVELERRASGTTFAEISGSEFKSIEVPVPPAAEQSAIARILDILDTQIEKTQALIAKLEQVKEGLLHDLLTRGVDENGELRPSAEEAPQLYKESALGLIPRGWEAVTLGEIARRSGGLLQTGPFGAQLHSHEYVAEGVPVIMPQDIMDDGLSLESIAQITESKALTIARHRVRENDLVFSRRGDLSRCVSIEPHQRGWICGTGCLLARLPANEIDGYWLSHVYRRPNTQSQVLGRAVGSTMANLNTAILSKILIARPAIHEQAEIVRRIKGVRSRISAEHLKQKKLVVEKSGLMDDLLTGRIRVTPLLDREPAEAT